MDNLLISLLIGFCLGKFVRGLEAHIKEIKLKKSNGSKRKKNGN